MSYRFVSFYWYACVLRCVSLQLAISLTLLSPALKLCLQLAQTLSFSLPFSLLFLSAFASCFARHRLLLLLSSPCCCFWINKCHMWLCGLPACPFPVPHCRLHLLHLLRPPCGNGNNSRRFALHCRPTPPLSLCVLYSLLPGFSTCSIFYTFKSSVLWRFCSRFKK